MIAEKGRTGWLVVEAQNTNWMPGPNPELLASSRPSCFPGTKTLAEEPARGTYQP
jgi:hypothetical protein